MRLQQELVDVPIQDGIRSMTMRCTRDHVSEQCESSMQYWFHYVLGI